MPAFEQMKGKLAEEVVQRIATGTFFADWCYPNAKREKGKELCDLLVVFGDVAFVCQVKSLKLRSNGFYSRSEVEKNLRQLAGAGLRLLELKTPIALCDSRGSREDLDPTQLRKVHLLSVLVGEDQSFYSPFEQIGKFGVHVVSWSALKTMLVELDTVADFCNYLEAREALFASDANIVIEGGEDELLAHYLVCGRNFGGLCGSSVVLLVEGSWAEFLSRPDVIAKKKADAISYLWDKIIDHAHRAGGRYKIPAREMARLNRFQRRAAAGFFMDCQVAAAQDPDPNTVIRRCVEIAGTTFTFLFAHEDKPVHERGELLRIQCFLVRGIVRQNTKVIGIATEKAMDTAHSFDFAHCDIGEWTPEYEKEAQRLQGLLGIWTDVNSVTVVENEYPRDIHADARDIRATATEEG